MSSAAPKTAKPAAAPEWDRLEQSLRRLLAQHDALRKRASAAEERARALESALKQVSSGKLDPVALSEKADTLERENRVLAKRLNQAHETLERIMGRLQFLEDER
jgi:predicted  nucleic acid-binding Zn-ribbon protein